MAKEEGAGKVAAARQARRLVRMSPVAALATGLAGDRGEAAWPYASLVTVAADHDGAPLLLLSELAEHSANIAQDGRISLLFAPGLGAGQGAEGGGDPLAGPRLTVLGHARRSREPRHRTRFLARHPAAEGYADFGDFHFYRLAVARAHLVAGFGRVRWVAAADFLLAGNWGDLAAAEPDILARVNPAQAGTLARRAEGLGKTGGTGGDPWRMTGIDPEGCDLRRGAAVARLDFAAAVRTAAAARAALTRLWAPGRGGG